MLHGLRRHTRRETDPIKELAVGLVFGGLLVWLPYLLIHRSPRRWWFYTVLLSLPVMFFVMFIMAHEMGHYVLHHVMLGILVGFGGTLVGLD